MMTRTLALATLVERRLVARDTWILEFEFPMQGQVRAGQFAMILPEAPGCLLPRPFSILAHRESRLSLLVKEVGVGSRALARLDAGVKVQAFAPLGSWFDPARFEGRKLILVAGGVGLVPLHRLREEILQAGGIHPSPSSVPAALKTSLANFWKDGSSGWRTDPSLGWAKVW